MREPVLVTGMGIRGKLASFCLCIAVLLFLHQVFAEPGVFYFRDTSLNHIPIRFYTTPVLRGGNLPLWNPYLAGGMPLLANPNNLILHPITLLFLVFPVLIAFHLSIFLQYLLAAWGLLRWAREKGFSDLGGVLGGVAFAFSGGLASCGTLHNLISSWAWVPVCLYAFVRNRRTGSATSFLAFSATLAVQLLAGDPLAVVTSIFLCLVELADRTEESPEKGGRALWALGLGVALSAGLALVQILPAQEMLENSIRGQGVPYGQAVTWSLEPVRLLEGIVPGLYGDPTTLRPGTYWGGRVFHKGYPFLLSVYFGVIPLLLAVASLGRRKGKGGYLLWGGTLFAILLSLGPEGFLYPLLYKYMPLVSSLRYPSRFLLPAFLFLSILAVSGFEHLRDGRKERMASRGQKMIGVTSLVVGVVCAGLGAFPALIAGLLGQGRVIPTGLGESAIDEILGSLSSSFLRTGLMAVVLAGLLALARHRRAKNAPVWITLVLVVALDLTTANSHVNPVVPASFYDERPVVATTLTPEDPQHRTFLEPRPQGFAVMAASNSAWWGYRWDLFSLRVGTPLLHRYYMAYGRSTDLLSSPRVKSLGDRMAQARGVDVKRMSDLASVATILTYRTLEAPDLKPLKTITGQTNIPLQVYQNQKPLPRAYLVSRALPAPTPAWEALTSVDFHPREEIYLEGLTHPMGARGACGVARLVENQPEKIVIEASATSEGWLVLTDNHYPGWRAELDGKEVAIERANFLFRAVPISPGQHRLVFTYRPRSLFWGGLGSLASLGLGLVGAWFFRRPVS